MFPYTVCDTTWTVRGHHSCSIAARAAFSFFLLVGLVGLVVAVDVVVVVVVIVFPGIAFTTPGQNQWW